MPSPVSYSQEYDRVRKRLTPGERILVGEAEDRISQNPSPDRRGRFEVDTFVYDSAAEDFLIEYRVLSDGVVSFDRLIDLRNPDL